MASSISRENIYILHNTLFEGVVQFGISQFIVLSTECMFFTTINANLEMDDNCIFWNWFI